MKRAAILAALILATACAKAAAGGGDYTPSQAADRIAAGGEGVYVLDVRTPAELATGVVPGIDGAADWNAWASSFPALSPAPAKNQEIIVYCRSGRRSGEAAAWLREQGYSKVFNLTGGITRWATEVGTTATLGR